MKETSIIIWKDALNYIIVYMKECLVVFHDLFIPLCPASLFVSCSGFSQGQAESGLVFQDKELT